MRALPAAVALLALLPYLPSAARGEFLNWDDPYLVHPGLLEQKVTRLLDPRGDPREPEGRKRAAFGSEYLPLRDLSYRLDARIHGLEPPSARGFRATNLLLYALACGLCARLLLELARLAGWSLPTAGFAALLFAWHPAHAESAAWIAGRKDVLSGALAFAALLAWLRAREPDHPHAARWQVATCALAAAACLSKSTAVALPFLALSIELLDPRDRFVRPPLRRLLDLLPLLVTCALLALLAMWVGGRTGVRQPPRPLSIVLLADLVVLRRYLVTALFPLELRIDHGDLVQAVRLRADALVWPSWLLIQALVSLAALAPLVVGALRMRASWPRWGLVWALGGLLPVMNLVPLPHWIADRFLFLPALAAAVLVARLGLSFERVRRGLGVALLALLLVGWAGLSLRRGLELATSESLWEAELERRPGDPLALHHLGDARLAQAAREPDPERAEALRFKGIANLEASLRAYERLLVRHPAEREARILLRRARESR